MLIALNLTSLVTGVWQAVGRVCSELAPDNRGTKHWSGTEIYWSLLKSKAAM